MFTVISLPKTGVRSVSIRNKAKQQIRIIMRIIINILLLFILQQSLSMHYSLWKIPGSPLIQQHKNGLNQTDPSLSSLVKIAFDQHFSRKQDTSPQRERNYGSSHREPQMVSYQDIGTKAPSNYYIEKLQQLINNYLTINRYLLLHT